MRCIQCGARIKKRINFCPVCGERVSFYNEAADYKPYREKRAKVDTQSRQEVLDEEISREMVGPLSGQRRKQKRWIIAAAFLILLMIVGLFCVLDIIPKLIESPVLNFFASAKEQDEQLDSGAKTATKSEGALAAQADGESKIPNVRSDFYEQGLELLNDYFDETNLEKAKTVGSEAFFSYMNQINADLQDYTKKALNTDEALFATTLRELCLYSLSNDAEEGMIDEFGGGEQEADVERIKLRREKAQRLNIEFQRAEKTAELEALRAELNDGN